MKRLSVAGLIAGVCIATAILYNPLNIAIFKLREPYFAPPARTENGVIRVRHDSLGSGGFDAKRRGGRSHIGIDIAAPVGTPVIASKSGTAFRLNVPTGYGKYVMVYHPDGSQTIYAHLSEWNIHSTQRVRQGDVIGLAGKTGNARSDLIEPHVHFEVRMRGEPVNPLIYMSPSLKLDNTKEDSR